MVWEKQRKTNKKHFHRINGFFSLHLELRTELEWRLRLTNIYRSIKEGVYGNIIFSLNKELSSLILPCANFLVFYHKLEKFREQNLVSWKYCCGCENTVLDVNVLVLDVKVLVPGTVPMGKYWSLEMKLLVAWFVKLGPKNQQEELGTFLNRDYCFSWTNRMSKI